MRIRLRNTEGKVVRSIEVRDDVFGVPMNAALVHQVMVGQMANARQGTASTKNRAAVSGGGRNPRRAPATLALAPRALRSGKGEGWPLALTHGAFGSARPNE